MQSSDVTQYQKLKLATIIKTQQMACLDVEEDVLALVDKIDVIKSDDNTYALGSKDAIVQSLLTQYSERGAELAVYETYVTVFKVTSLTNLLESILTALTVWSVCNGGTSEHCFKEQSIKVQALDMFTTVDEARVFVQKSLFLSKKDFSDAIIDYANALNINDEKEKDIPALEAMFSVKNDE